MNIPNCIDNNKLMP